MKCKVCNSELIEGQAFCSYCGTKIEAESEIQQPVAHSEAEASEYIPPATVTEPISEQPPINEKDPADGHALAGLILGICSLVCCCIGLPSGIIGIILSAKGLKSKTRKGMAIPGLILSILAVIYFFSFWVGFAQGLSGTSEIFEYLSLMVSNLTF